jgi:hypothetical protein
VRQHKRAGQLFDGIATPLVGVAIDRHMLPLCIMRRFGARNSWHVIGAFVCARVRIDMHRYNYGDIVILVDFQPLLSARSDTL